MTSKPEPKKSKKTESKEEAKKRIDLQWAAWLEFQEKIPTEKEAWDFLAAETANYRPSNCSFCHGDEFTRIAGTRYLICNNCGKEVSTTVGTFFEGIKLARPRLGMVWFLERKIPISINRFRELLGIGYQTAWDIFQSFATLIRENIPASAIPVLSSEFKPTVGRRSSETPARAHPHEEQEEFEREYYRSNKQERQNPFAEDLSEQNQEIYKVLLERPVTAETVCQQTGLPLSAVSANLTILELSGLVTRTFGDRYTYLAAGLGNLLDPEQSQTKNLSAEIADKIDGIINFVITNFHRISRKYIQNFQTIYWCCTDTKTWGKGMLMNACLQANRVGRRTLRSYNSPMHIQVMPDS